MVTVVLPNIGGHNGYGGSGRESGLVPSAASSLGAAVYAAGVGTPEIRGRNGLKRVGLGRPGFRPFRMSGQVLELAKVTEHSVVLAWLNVGEAVAFVEAAGVGINLIDVDVHFGCAPLTDPQERSL
ncbi:hypothetical protein SAMN04489742_0553 [Arthrobacter crystallopoietes]|uniref:Uncharacterized protein n=1 Tax=Crystallibacter crystallopoietes TaxID=37928 RepID=A0A1H0ZTI2_9MICC|nr:hypothetical protein SAMN04489742_0553 [Arthrobacter crystallopoietes]